MRSTLNTGWGSVADSTHRDEGERLEAYEPSILEDRLPYDPDDGGVLLRGLSVSWIAHVALAGGLFVYGLTLSAHGDLVAVSAPQVQRPVLAIFAFEQPEPEAHLVPQQVASTTAEPEVEPQTPVEPPVVKKTRTRKSPKARTARRSKRRAPKVLESPAAVIAPAVAGSSASTVAPIPTAAPAVASGPATIAPPAPSTAGEKSAVDRKGLLKAYVKSLSKAVRKRRAYPRAAKLAGLEGRAIVRIVLDASGSIVDIQLAKSSGHDILDRAALEAARSVGRLPAAPSDLHWGTRAIKVPFRFKVTT
jgi:periplasmic protein TonB